jgi:uncharacterized membrane protein
MVPATRTTLLAAFALVLVTSATAVFLLLEYPSLPDLLPVHFNRYGAPNGWQYRTVARVLVPVAVQAVLGGVLGAVALLLLWRPERVQSLQPGDLRAAAAAAEAVVLIALIWVTFQGYAAFSLARLWASPRGTLPYYSVGELAGGMASLVVAIRAHRRLGRPDPRPFDPAHWRFGQLYSNPADPALFVPTRDGRRWTLNFGRPVAGALLGLILTAGILAPTVLLALALR